MSFPLLDFNIIKTNTQRPYVALGRWSQGSPGGSDMKGESRTNKMAYEVKCLWPRLTLIQSSKLIVEGKNRGKGMRK